METRVRFPSPAFARSCLAGYSAAGPAFGHPDQPEPLKGRKRRAVAQRRRTSAAVPSRRNTAEADHLRYQPCITFTFLNPLPYPVISTSARPRICGNACASIRPMSMLMRRNTVLGSSRPTWHSRRKPLRLASRVISNPARVAHFVSVTSTSGSLLCAKGYQLSHHRPLVPRGLQRGVKWKDGRLKV